MSEQDHLPGDLDLWVEERHRDVVAQRYRVSEVLFSGESPYQRVHIVRTEGHGRMLLNDGLIMISEADEFIYHEMIAHVPLFVHPQAKRVLVIGGGDGGTVREVIRHASVERCWLVEIDAMVVDACREFIPQTAACLDEDRVEVHIADGVKFVAETDERFDVVLVDSTDPIGPAQPLFGPEFYANVRRVLAPGGIVVSQGESPFYEGETQESMLKILGGLFSKVHLYNFVNMTYPGGLWSFTFASDSRCPLSDLDEERVGQMGGFSWYSSAVHRGAFALPAFMGARLGDHLTPLPS